ncbi:unnamed protein product [Citrullus colocynthis]|uniref:Uncharacterized protein n=1 Tax=Citrullus colocynthis TaxID=252529 RepID=A0ABP0ZB51_9ROSI
MVERSLSMREGNNPLLHGTVSNSSKHTSSTGHHHHNPHIILKPHHPTAVISHLCHTIHH